MLNTGANYHLCAQISNIKDPSLVPESYRLTHCNPVQHAYLQIYLCLNKQLRLYNGGSNLYINVEIRALPFISPHASRQTPL